MKIAFQKREKFEIQILRFICIIGILRMIVEFYSNYIRDISINGWIIDTSLTTLIVLFLFLTFTAVNEKWLTYSFSIVALVYMAISWINQGGIYGRSEYNYFVIILIIGIIHTRRHLYIFVISVVLIQVALVALWEYDFSLFEPYILTFSEWPLHYIGVVILTTLFINFLRLKNDQEVRIIDEHNEQLSRRAVQVDIENSNLLLQQKEFAIINSNLELEIAKRKKVLDAQNKSLQDFIEISLKEFYPPMQSILSAVQKTEEKHSQDNNVKMLLKSCFNLQKAYEGMKAKLKNNIQ